MLTGTPLALALGAAVAPQPPSESVRFVNLVLANQSPFICTVRMSNSGAAPTLQPYQAMLYPLAPGDLPTVTPTTNTSSGASVTTGWLSADWYFEVDKIAGTYPAALVVNAGQTQVGNTPGGVLQTYAKSPPAVAGVTGAYQYGTNFTTPSATTNLNMSSVSAGFLMLVAVSFRITNNTQLPAGDYSAVLPASDGWAAHQTVLSVPAATYYGASFLFWAIRAASNGTSQVTMNIPAAAVAAVCNYQVYAVHLGSANGSNTVAFSNDALTGLVSDSVAWTASGLTNQNLSSASPAVWAAPITYLQSTVTFSVGAEYYSTNGLWVASSQTGPLAVDTTGNPETLSPNIGDVGLVIPQ